MSTPVSPSAHSVLAFWGKARPDTDAAHPWHPVAYHLLDVAATAQAILAARPVTRARAGRLLGTAPDDAARLLVALIALHDLGKFAPAFQVKAPELWPASLGICAPERVRPGRHTDDGYVLWESRLAALARERLWPQGHHTLAALAPAIFGHHGRPVRNLYGPSEREVYGAGLGAAITCAETVLALLMPAPLDVPAPPDERARIASWWVAGLTSVADWIGSSQRRFCYTAPLADDTTLGGYWAVAQAAAAAAVRETGLAAPGAAPRRSFGGLTGGKSPTPVQSWADEV